MRTTKKWKIKTTTVDKAEVDFGSYPSRKTPHQDSRCQGECKPPSRGQPTCDTVGELRTHTDERCEGTRQADEAYRCTALPE